MKKHTKLFQLVILFISLFLMIIGSAFPEKFSMASYVGLILGFLIPLVDPFYGVIILLAILYWPVIQLGSRFSNIPISFFIIVPIIIGTFIRRSKYNSINQKDIPLFLLFFLVILYTVISLLGTKDYSYGLKYTIWVMRGISVFVLVVFFTDGFSKLRNLLKGIAIIGFFTFLIAAAHYFTGLSQTWTLIKPQTGVVDLFNRLIYFGTEPNYLALLYLPAVSASVINFEIERNKYLKGIWFISFLGNTVGIIGTYSRAGMICITLLLLGYLILFRKQRILILLTLILGSILLLVFEAQIYNRFSSIYTSIMNEGMTGRTYYWSLAIDLWSKNFSSLFFGLGVGGFIYRVGMAVHNTPLTVLVDFGLIGFILYYLPFIVVISRTRFKIQDPDLFLIQKGLLLGLFGVFIGFLSISDIGSIPFFFTLGLLCTIYKIDSHYLNTERSNIPSFSENSFQDYAKK
jgi:hypothetical protein